MQKWSIIWHVIPRLVNGMSAYTNISFLIVDSVPGLQIKSGENIAITLDKVTAAGNRETGDFN